MTAHLIGRRVFVDVQAWRRPDGPKYLDQNFVGEIVGVGTGTITVRREDTGRLEEVRGRPDVALVAGPDGYVLRSTGTVVAQPDYCIEYTRVDVAPGTGWLIGVAVDPDV